jgi:hypothetical protein
LFCNDGADGLVHTKTPGCQDVITFDEHSSGAGESRGIAHFGFRLVSSGDIDAAVDEVEHAGGKLLRRANSVLAAPTPTSLTRMATKSKFGMSEPAALGFRTHSGWTVVVAVAGSLRRPVVLEGRRIETADTGRNVLLPEHYDLISVPKNRRQPL